MGRLDIFCSSPASTAICSGTVRNSHRPSDRHVHHRHDHDHDRFRQKYQHQQPKPSTSRKSSSPSSSAEVHDLAGTIRPRPRPLDSDSSRYLLSNNNITPTSSDFVEEHKSKPPPILVRHHDSPKLIESSPSSYARHNQVVVLRVSLHCKGCEAKVRKHISKMEGVTSFSIDMETKKVTVKGNVTPSGVLESVSRVKNAQLWPMS